MDAIEVKQRSKYTLKSVQFRQVKNGWIVTQAVQYFDEHNQLLAQDSEDFIAPTQTALLALMKSFTTNRG